MNHDSESVISVKNLTQRYGTGRIIYSDLSFEVPKGRILGLLGKNGTGKTTTINILMGYLRPQKGECRIFGEKITEMSPATRAGIALLIEGHVQYAFMTIEQIERFYSRFYPKWNRDAYYELMNKLHVSPGQKISSMSCGQRSQVALGLILAQNADLLVLDDFSLGLDPGYRRLFTDYLREFAKAEEKTVFMTSHIIQDLERLIDDCIILDYGKILTQMPVDELLRDFCRYTLQTDMSVEKFLADSLFVNPGKIKDELEFYTFKPIDEVRAALGSLGVDSGSLVRQDMSLEDAFIGLTGKY
ncbi:ABC transporter ATP-binding protein [Muribaculaceae bacterium Isolate-039 (Harlan)]|jgi:ABC-2 type transport system ATP-binding protein|uniref:ABC transporter ATP-binding protein n=1 Tax=Duncaniella muris TaxID=2094150 RepID=UPI000F4A765F|nr:ABC transporter ATP-binding protein [Duncaniella muris]ROS86624.1 ABC transporter ATP-binding protein [Muribaculaceae bacterium Isolate-039 (Harlan)]ROS95504.1 ABC transporter ATP-binding protein [Muribaculaceae bacterium Isolate-083 (Janvier)]ROS96025.1 ABC transporter ATP-binding protein [Muribaculaceae bacterium Isolate-077 (Janvier)]ROS99521.1 ABC transporter ATP-binding protein [Muribaculaceae bacterium Isolate-084 (Janvier)]